MTYYFSFLYWAEVNKKARLIKKIILRKRIERLQISASVLSHLS